MEPLFIPYCVLPNTARCILSHGHVRNLFNEFNETILVLEAQDDFLQIVRHKCILNESWGRVIYVRIAISR